MLQDVTDKKYDDKKLGKSAEKRGCAINRACARFATFTVSICISSAWNPDLSFNIEINITVYT